MRNNLLNNKILHAANIIIVLKSNITNYHNKSNIYNTDLFTIQANRTRRYIYSVLTATKESTLWHIICAAKFGACSNLMSQQTADGLKRGHLSVRTGTI